MAFRVKQTPHSKRDLDLILERLLAEGAGETGLRLSEIVQREAARLDEMRHDRLGAAAEQG